MRRRGVARRRGHAGKKRLTWERTGTENRKSAYMAEGFDALDGGKTTYHLYNEAGVWRLSGDNVRRTGGYIATDVADAKRRAEAIDAAAETAFKGAYSLTADVVALHRRGK